MKIAQTLETYIYLIIKNGLSLSDSPFPSIYSPKNVTKSADVLRGFAFGSSSK